MRARIILQLSSFRKRLLGVFPPVPPSAAFAVGISVVSCGLLGWVRAVSCSELSWVPILLIAIAGSANGSGEDYERDYGGKGPRVVIYVRVSSANQQNKGLSLGLQEEELLEWVQKYQPSHIHVMKDGGKSGVDFAKRKIGEISRLKAEGKIDEVWVRSVDRLGRDCLELVAFFIPFILKGGIIRTQTDSYTKDPQDFKRFCDEAFKAETSNRERTKIVLASKRKSFRLGNWNTQIPFGYRRKQSDKWIEKNPEQEPIVAEIFETFIRNPSYKAVQTEIWGKYKVQLSRDRIGSILRNSVYIGKASLYGEVKPDNSLVYVQEAKFSEAQILSSEIESKKQRKSDRIFQQIVYEDVWSLRHFLEKVHDHYDQCKTRVSCNGVHKKMDPPQINFICQKRVHQWRFPLRRLKAISPLLPYDLSEPGNPGIERNLSQKTQKDPEVDHNHAHSTHSLGGAENPSSPSGIAHSTELGIARVDAISERLNQDCNRTIIERKFTQNQPLVEERKPIPLPDALTMKSSLSDDPVSCNGTISNWDEFYEHLSKFALISRSESTLLRLMGTEWAGYKKEYDAEFQKLATQEKEAHQEAKHRLLRWVDSRCVDPASHLLRARILRSFGEIFEVRQDYMMWASHGS